MTHDARTLLQDAVDRVPSHAGDLQAIEDRARQRTRRSRTGAAVGVVALVLAVAGLVRLPADPPPVVDQGTESTQLDVQLCNPQSCPDTPITVEDAASAVEDVPGVTGVEIVDAEERRQEMAEAFDAPADTIHDDLVAPGLTVGVRGAAELATVAGRVAQQVPGASVRRGPVASHVVGTDPFDDAAPSGPATTVATLDVAGQQVDVRVWPVDGGGRCTEVGALVACWADRFYEGEPEAATLAWGRPADRVTCTWAPAGPGVQGVEATFADGQTVDGVVEPAPPGVLTGVQVACVGAETHPSSLATDTGQASAARVTSYAAHTEVRADGVVGWPEVSQAVESALTYEDAIELAALDDEAAQQDGLAEVLQAAASIEGVTNVAVTGRTHGPHPAVGEGGTAPQVAATVTVAGGDPICVVAVLGQPRGMSPLRTERPAIWTPDAGCPPLL